MDTTDLAALVPALMAAHPHCRWTLSPAPVPGADLVLDIRPQAWPDRIATVRVNAGAEVFALDFAGHCGHDFAYDDESRPEVLRERIDLAVRAVTGPTRVIRDSTAAGRTVRSVLLLDHGRPQELRELVTVPFARLRALFTGQRVGRETIDFPGSAAAA
ncbi:hypothetical protein [Actinoplanes sp. DH11]|uniref:hypothetical protein n=1 Tax=Actinoplanes sp. DH11 TaxID=2857011 RepID=UPI001E5D03F5|nr:hypothetical protein [Actinoplanes sp. DH11]